MELCDVAVATAEDELKGVGRNAKNAEKQLDLAKSRAPVAGTQHEEAIVGIESERNYTYDENDVIREILAYAIIQRWNDIEAAEENMNIAKQKFRKERIKQNQLEGRIEEREKVHKQFVKWEGAGCPRSWIPTMDFWDRVYKWFETSVDEIAPKMKESEQYSWYFR